MTDRPEPPPQVGMSTFLVHGKFVTQRWDFNHHTVPPMSASVTYRLDSAERGGRGFTQFGKHRDENTPPVYIYDRLDEPTRGMLEDDLARAEAGEICVTYSTGMAAIAAALGITVRPGDRIVAWRTIYGCTYSLLTNWYRKRLGIDVEFVDFANLDEVRQAITPNTRVLYFESPANPTLELADVEAITAIAREAEAGRDLDQRIHVIVDNTFATPVCQRPLKLGADLVVHSLTKNIGGFGTDMGGAVIGELAYEEPLLMYRKDFGGVLAPKAAWPILVYGLPTLPLRVKRQMDSAAVIAQFLEMHPKVARVAYPGLSSFPQRELAVKQMRDIFGNFAPGTLIYFETNEESPDGHEVAGRLIDWIAKNSYCITLAVSLGNIRTLIESPGLMTHATIPQEEREAGHIAPNGVRLSVGIEKADDIVRDLKAALDYA